MSTDPTQAREALAEVRRRQQQTVAEGVRPWPWRQSLGAASSLVAMGIALDADMVWLMALFAVGLAASLRSGAVELRRSAVPGRRPTWALPALVLVMIVADIAVQFVVRALGWPIPNTLGSAAAALVLLAGVRPIQTRLAERTLGRS